MNDPKHTWSKNGEKWAPMSKSGGLHSYYGSWLESDTEWKEVSEPIELTLKFKDYGRGRSSVVLYFEDVNREGAVYPMFISDFSNAFAIGILHPITHGSWLVVKKGANYGIQVLLNIVEEK